MWCLFLLFNSDIWQVLDFFWLCVPDTTNLFKEFELWQSLSLQTEEGISGAYRLCWCDIINKKPSLFSDLWIAAQISFSVKW